MNDDISTVTPGCTVAWSSDTPRPPDRFTKKLAAWQAENGHGRVTSVQHAVADDGSTRPWYITVLTGTVFGTCGAVIARSSKIISLEQTSGTIKVIARPAAGNVLIFEDQRPKSDLVHLAADAAAAAEWLSRRSYPNARLETVKSPYEEHTLKHGLNPDTPETVRFVTSETGLEIAEIGDCRYIAVTAGEHHLMRYSWRASTDILAAELSEFYMIHKVLDSPGDFRKEAIKLAIAAFESSILSRSQSYGSPVNTPWGISQTAVCYAPGITQYTTAGHGGIHLSTDRNQYVHPNWREPDGWYEEDQMWAVVCVTYPQFFKASDYKSAVKTLRDTCPDDWEVIFDEKIPIELSASRRVKAFYQAHAADWLVYSAINVDDDTGMVKCMARLGEGLARDAEERIFLVPATEYEARTRHFVIDLSRHRDVTNLTGFGSDPIAA